MKIRSLLALSLSILALSPAIGGLVSRENTKSEPAASAPARPRQAPDAEPVERAAASSDKPSPGESDKPARAPMEQEKMVLNRLVTALQRSPRSFIYLRSIGFTQSDQEFERVIAKNDAIFRRTRIVRRDEQGNRQIPGWPGIALTEEYKAQRH